MRQSGPACLLSDSEVLCIEVAGLFLGQAQDKDNFLTFALIIPSCFPISSASIAPLTRAKAPTCGASKNCCGSVWWRLCRTRRRSLLWIAYRCRCAALPARPGAVNFKSADVSGLQASYGWDHVARQTFFGLRLHVRVAYPGVITGFCLTGAEVSDVAATPQLLEGAQGLVLGDRNYASPALQEQLRREGGQAKLLTAAKSRKREADKRAARWIARVRYRIETVFGQLCGRLQIRGIQVKDTWHLASRLLRAALCHTISLHLTLAHDIKPLQFAKLLD